MAELNGIILVNKPVGISSARVVNKIKKIFNVDKVGHAGTLDPFATGLLICCINKATRLSQFFLTGDKKYKGVLRLGIETDTQDLTGTIIKEASFDHITVDNIIEIFSKFKGHMFQKAPFFSALKYNGVPLYKLARKGIYVSKPPRPIIIYSLEIYDINFPEISFEVHCSSGTYVRTICSDIGKRLGCGGYLKSLHRVSSSNFYVDKAHELRDLEISTNYAVLPSFILPMADSLDFMSTYIADQSLVGKIRNGVRLKSSDFVNNSNINLTFDGPFFKVIDSMGSLVAVINNSNDSLFYNYCCVF